MVCCLLYKNTLSEVANFYADKTFCHQQGLITDLWKKLKQHWWKTTVKSFPSATTVWDFSNISNTTFATATGSTCLSFLLGGLDIRRHWATGSNRFLKSLTILHISVAFSVPTHRAMSCHCVVCHVTCKHVNETFPLQFFFFFNCLKHKPHMSILKKNKKTISCYTCVFFPKLPCFNQAYFLFAASICTITKFMETHQCLPQTVWMTPAWILTPSFHTWGFTPDLCPRWIEHGNDPWNRKHIEVGAVLAVAWGGVGGWRSLCCGGTIFKCVMSDCGKQRC